MVDTSVLEHEPELADVIGVQLLQRRGREPAQHVLVETSPGETLALGIPGGGHVGGEPAIPGLEQRAIRRPRFHASARVASGAPESASIPVDRDDTSGDDVDEGSGESDA